MNYRTLCRNPECLAPIGGHAPVKLYCNETCKASATAWAKTATRDQMLAFEDRFIATWQENYDTPCFGIETEYGP